MDYRAEPDPGVHAAAEWLLRRWQMAGRLAPIDQALRRAGSWRSPGAITKPLWRVNGQGQTFAVIPAPGRFEIGSPADEKRMSTDEARRRAQIDYPIAVAAKPVTVAEFKKFRPGFEYVKQYTPGQDAPINSVSWYDAAAYCNWLSDQEKIPRDQWCYEPNAKGEYAEGMKVKPNYQRLSGYRLPREAEWEYACRAGTVTAWSYGSDEATLGHYGWYDLNSNGTMHAVGSLKPNGLGLFDMHGNAWQWCQDDVYEGMNKDITYVKSNFGRFMRGGSFYADARDTRSANRGVHAPEDRHNLIGFRVARTYR
jgi:hypothetical protein